MEMKVSTRVKTTKVDLNSAEYTKQFAEAPVYAKKAIVEAVQLTEEGLANGDYAHKGVWFGQDEASSEKGESYCLHTYVMQEVNGIRIPVLETTNEVKAGMWVVTNPSVRPEDVDNNYAMSDADFRKRYELTEETGVYRAKGMARIIPNTTGGSVEIVPPWGGLQVGGVSCYFCAPYSKDNPDDLAEGERYILSENDFSAYGLASKVLAK